MRYFLVSVCIAFFAATLFWLSKAKWPLGVQGQWQITPNAGAWPLPAWGLPLAVLFVFGGLAVLSAYDRFKRAKNEKEQRGSTRLCILALSILAFAWPWALLGPGGTGNLIAAQWSDISNEYFGASYQVENVRAFSQNYAAKSQTPQSALQAHVATHPPGAVLFYVGARRVYEATPFLQSTFENLAAFLTSENIETLSTQSNQLRISAEHAAGVKTPDGPLPVSAVGAALWCAFLISLLLASCVPATYFIASIANGVQAGSTPDASTPDADEARGMTAAALLALAPTVSLFAFTLDALIACGAAWTMAFVALRLRGGKKFWMVCSGAAMALTSFVSFGALAIAVIAIVALLFARRRAALQDIAFFGVGFIALWLVLLAIFPMQPLSIFQNAMAMHRMATVQSRSRGAWLWMNIASYAVFCGWPLFLAAISGGAQFFAALRHEKFASRLNGSTPALIGAAALVTLLLLTVSGAARGEVERLWLFLTPSLAAIAAVHLMQRGGAKSIGILLALQAAQTIFMAAWLAPLVRPL